VEFPGTRLHAIQGIIFWQRTACRFAAVSDATL